MSAQWYVRTGDQDKRGPFTADQLRTAALKGEVSPADLLTKEGMASWVPASQVKGLFPQPASAGAAEPIQPPAIPPTAGREATGAATVHRREQLAARALDTLFASQLPAITAGSSSLIAKGKIPAKKLEGAKQYSDQASDATVRVLFDATMFGTGSEGFVILTNGIAWRNPGNSKNGWMAFDKLEPAAIGTAVETGLLGGRYLVLGHGDAKRIKCGSLDLAIVEQLASMLVNAARIAKGSDPTLLRAEARDAAGASDFTTAASKWARAADDPDASAPEIIDEVRAAMHKYDAPAPLEQLLDDLAAKATDRSRNWSLKQSNRRFAERVTADDLAQRWSNGRLFHDDSVRHFGEPDWYAASDAEPVAQLPRSFFRDTGPYDPKRFDAVVNAVRLKMGDSRPLFLGPVGSDSTEGLHVGVFDKDIVRVIAADVGVPGVDVLPVAAVSVVFDDASGKESVAGGRLRFGGDTYSIRVPQGPGVVRLREVWKRVSLESAKQSAAQERLCEAQRTLCSAYTKDDPDAGVVALLKTCTPIVEAVADYHGGHPSITEQVRGTLRIDEKGMEFTPEVPNANGYMRIRYADLVEIAPPVLGDLPAEIANSHASKQAAGAALSLAAALLGGGQSGRAIGRAMRPDQAAVKPTKNRLGVSIRSEGTTYRLFFDITGTDRDVIEKTAKDFWASAASVRGRFGKSTGGDKPQGRDARTGNAPLAVPLGSDTRDLLLLCLELQLTGEVSEKLVASGRFTAEQLGKRRNAAIEKLGVVLSGGGARDAAKVGASTPDARQGKRESSDAIPGVGASITPPASDKPNDNSRMSAGTAAAIGLGVGVLAAGVASAAMGAGRSSVASGHGDADGTDLLDLDHDGRPDGIVVDTDGDGTADAVGIDRDGDGHIDAVGVDRDGDGDVDAIGFDTDGDGRIDAVGMDTDGDGDIDAVAIDSDGDGDADEIAMDTDDDGDMDAIAYDADDDGEIDSVAVDDDLDDDTDYDA